MEVHRCAPHSLAVQWHTPIRMFGIGNAVYYGMVSSVRSRAYFIRKAFNE